MNVVGVESPKESSDLTDLFRRHQSALLGLAFVLLGDRLLAEDTVQEAFARFGRAGSCKAGAELAYLRRTVVNLCHGHHRRLRIARRRTPAAAEDVAGADGPALERAAQREVVAAVRRLPRRQRDCVVLHFYGGLSDAEIGASLGISVGSVKTHLHRARAALRTRLEHLR